MTKIKKFSVFLFVFIFIISLIPNYLIADQASDVSAFVARFYRLCLQRSAEPDGLSWWASELTSGRKTGAQVANGFVFSQEFTSRNVSNAEFVNIMYSAFFNRQPDSGGYNAWMNDLSSGKSRQYVLAGFVNSTEFRNLCASYGITAGSISVSQPSTLTVPQPVGNIRNIVVLGDSQVTDPRKWPEYLAARMVAGYPQYDFRLFKSGVGGEIITQGYSRMSSLYSLNPQIFIINYGTNDGNGPHVGSYRVEPSKFGYYLGLMIDNIRSNTGAVVVVMSTAPSYNREQSHPMGNLTNINNEARRVTLARGAVYVDIFNSMIGTGNYVPYLSDGLHYSDLGSQYAAQVAYNAISAQFQ